MLRFLFVMVLVLAIGVAAYGSAAALNVVSGPLQAGSDETLICDQDGVQIAYRDGWDASLDDFGITHVTVGGVDSSCNGRLVEVVLTDINGNWLAQGAVASWPPADDNAVPVSPVVPAAYVYDVHVIIR